ncbi:MAG: hypothetical protein ACFB01_02780 [Cohaesibacteraceae bacterium]
MSPDPLPVTDPLPETTLPERPWPRAAAIVVLFALVGPALGGLIGGLLLASFMVIGSDATVGEALAAFFPVATLLSVYGALFGYWLGVVPAVVAGAVVAWHEGWRGPVTGWSALLLGSGIGAIYFMVSEFMALEGGRYGASFAVIVCLVPTYLLSRIARFWGRNDPVAEVAS